MNAEVIPLLQDMNEKLESLDRLNQRIIITRLSCTSRYLTELDKKIKIDKIDEINRQRKFSSPALKSRNLQLT